MGVPDERSSEPATGQRDEAAGNGANRFQQRSGRPNGLENLQRKERSGRPGTLTSGWEL